MSVEDFNDNTFFQFLENASKLLLVKFDMKLSSGLIQEIKNIVQSTRPKIDGKTVHDKFINLQDTIEVEFSKKGAHNEKIIKQLLRSVRKTLKTNLAEYQKTFQGSSKLEKVQQRSDSGRNIELLKKMIINCATNEEEKLIGISYAYLGLVNGTYRLSMQDCYGWQRLGQGDSVDPESLKNMEVADVKDYFTTKGLPLDYFDGWDSTVRNAVGHSNFHYDSDKQRMIYIDEPNDPTKKRTIDYSFVEMVENYEKIESVYHAILIINQIVMVSTACSVLTKRYSS